MSDQDPLSGLLGSFRRKKNKRAEPAPTGDDVDFSRKEKSAEEKGLNPLDLLGLPEIQRDLVNFLSRRKQATLTELQSRLQLDVRELATVIDELKQSGYLHEALLDGVVHYRVVFGGKVSRSARGVPQQIWDAVDLDNTVFLKQVPVFQRMSDEQLQAVAAQMTSRRYKRNEVIIWQGDVGYGVYFIKSGIVGISRISGEGHDDNTEVLAYLKQGDLLGEHNLLTDYQYSATATATALSEVELLTMRHEDFLNLLLTYDAVALRLARVLAERIVSVNGRLSSKGADTKLTVVISSGKVQDTLFGSCIAMSLAESTRRKAVYTEHPNPKTLASRFKVTAQQELSAQPGGFDIAVIEGTPGLPAAVRTTLVIDRLFNEYANVVVGLSGKIDDTVSYMLEKANQVILLADNNAAAEINPTLGKIRAHVHPERTSILVVARQDSNADEPDVLPQTDYIIPDLLGDIPALSGLTPTVVAPELTRTVDALVDRLGRTNQIGVYIPTTTDVDQVVDTSRYIDQTIAFLGQLFGGETATSNEAHGVWNSDEVGLVSEAIFIVRIFVTQAELDRYLGDVLEYVEQLKEELAQEAMAVEVNQKLMLI